MNNQNLNSKCNDYSVEAENQQHDKERDLYQSLPPLIICGKLIYPGEYLTTNYD